MSCYEITLTFTKTFYVEADSELKALQHEATLEEESFGGIIEYDFVEGEAREVSKKEYEFIPQELLLT